MTTNERNKKDLLCILLSFADKFDVNFSVIIIEDY